ncbi:flippase-like domain-containing protein [bacterium]|nr:flippase-like domain-containing protein [bacterium]
MKIQPKKLFTLLVTFLFIAFLVYIFRDMSAEEFINAFKMFHINYLFWIVSLYYFTMYLRGIRWKALLMDNPKYSNYHLGVVFMVGCMLNCFLPARAGDIYRAYYLGENKNESKMKIFGSVILERIQDGISVFFILLFAVLFYCKNNPIMTNAVYFFGFIFIGSMIAFYLIYKFNKIDFICQKIEMFFEKIKFIKLKNMVKSINRHANSFMDGFEVLDSLKLSIKSAVMSALIWGIECFIVYLILASFNLSLPFSASLFVISLISFSGMLPSTSIFFGPYQAAYLLALGIYGVNKSTILAISLVHPVLLIIILSVVGIYYLYRFNFSIDKIKEAQKEFEKNEN